MYLNDTDDGINLSCVDITEFQWREHSDLSALPSVMALFALMYSSIILTSLLGNLLVIVSVCRYKSLQSVRNMFIISLSVSDIVVSVVSGTITPINAFTKTWPFGKLLCMLVPVFQGTSLCFSTLTLSAISIDRFRLIVMPLRQPIQQRCACRIVAANSGIALAISLPMLFMQKLEVYDRFCGKFCSEDWTSMAMSAADKGEMARSLYGTFVFLAQFVVPFLIICTCYVMISIQINSGIMVKRASTEITKFNEVSICSSGPKMSTTTVTRLEGARGSACTTEESTHLLNNGSTVTNGHSRDARVPSNAAATTHDVLQVAMEQKQKILNRRLRTNRMLIAMVAVFFCCWAPSVVFNFLRDHQWLPTFVLSQLYLFGIITHCISMSSTIWNPVLYALLNEQFRTAFVEQFKQLRHCWWCCWRKHSFGSGHRFQAMEVVLNSGGSAGGVQRVAASSSQRCNSTASQPQHAQPPKKLLARPPVIQVEQPSSVSVVWEEIKDQHL